MDRAQALMENIDTFIEVSGRVGGTPPKPPAGRSPEGGRG